MAIKGFARPPRMTFSAEALDAQKVEGGYDLIKAIPNDPHLIGFSVRKGF